MTDVFDMNKVRVFAGLDTLEMLDVELISVYTKNGEILVCTLKDLEKMLLDRQTAVGTVQSVQPTAAELAKVYSDAAVLLGTPRDGRIPVNTQVHKDQIHGE